MKKLLGLVAVATLAFTSMVSAATLKIAYEFSPYMLNGQEIKAGQEQQLQAGKNQLVVAYYAVLKDKSSRSMFDSRPYVLTFKNPGSDVTLIAPRFRDHNQAERKFANGQVEWLLQDANGRTFKVKAEELPSRGGFMPYANVPGLVADYNNKHGISFLGQDMEDLQDVAVKVAQDGSVKVTGDAVTQLKLWYTKASKIERKKFRMWMLEKDFQ